MSQVLHIDLSEEPFAHFPRDSETWRLLVLNLNLWRDKERQAERGGQGQWQVVRCFLMTYTGGKGLFPLNPFSYCQPEDKNQPQWQSVERIPQPKPNGSFNVPNTEESENKSWIQPSIPEPLQSSFCFANFYQVLRKSVKFSLCNIASKQTNQPTNIQTGLKTLLQLRLIFIIEV